MILIFIISLALGSLVIAIFTGNTAILNGKRTALVKAVIKYQGSRWDYKELYDIVNSGEVESINVSSILDDENVGEIDSATNAIIEKFEERVMLLDDEGKAISYEVKSISGIERVISDELDEKHQDFANSIVKKAMSFTYLEKELLDLYVAFYSSKILLANNTKDLATKSISVIEYNGFEKKRKTFLKNVASQERQIVSEMKELDIEINDDIYRLLLALE